MGVEVDDADVNELVAGQGELTTEELLLLQERYHSDTVEEILLQEVLRNVIEVTKSLILSKTHRGKSNSRNAVTPFSNNWMVQFREILKIITKQISLRFLKKRTAEG